MMHSQAQCAEWAAQINLRVRGRSAPSAAPVVAGEASSAALGYPHQGFGMKHSAVRQPGITPVKGGGPSSSVPEGVQMVESM